MSGFDRCIPQPPPVLSAQRLPPRFVLEGEGACRCSGAWAAMGETDVEGRWSFMRTATTDEVRASCDLDRKT